MNNTKNKLEKTEIKSKNYWLNRYKWFITPLAIFLCLFMAKGISGLSMSTNYRVFFGDSNPQLLAFEELQNIYNKSDNALIVVEAKSGNIYQKDVLTAIHEITKMGWQIPFSTRVDSLTNYQHTEGSDDDLLVYDLVEDPILLDQNKLNKIRTIAENEPRILHSMVSPKGDVSAINITLELPGKSVTEVPTATAKVRELADTIRAKYPMINIYLSGMVIMNSTFPEASMRDMSKLNPIMFGIIFFLIFIMTRSIAGTLTTLVIVLLSILSGLGLGGYFKVALTPISITAVTVIMTLAVADCIHIIITFKEWLGKGYTRRASVFQSMKINFKPVLITSITTAIGFLSLNFSDTPPFHHYGNMSAVGVMVALFLSVTLLPISLMLFPSVANLNHTQNNRMEKFARWVIRHRTSGLVTVGSIAIFLAFMIPHIELNDQFVKYFGKEFQFRRDADKISEKLTGIYDINFSLTSELEGGVANPKYLKKLDEFSKWLREQKDIVHVNSLSDTFKRLNKNMHGDDEAWYKIPDSRELSAQYLLLYEFSLPYGLDLSNTINIDKSASKLACMLTNTSTKRMRELESLSNKWIKNNAKGIFTGVASSSSIMFSHISERNIESMISGTILSMIIITIIMMIALKSFRYGLLSLIPNLIPVVMAFGAWSLIVGQIGMAVATIAGLTIGIVVDDTVHFMSKYLRARQEEGLDPEEAIVYAFASVGKALIATSLILVCGFLVMSFSSFRINWTMGLMSAITILFALIADFIFLPGVLLTYERLRYGHKVSTSTSLKE